MLALTYMLDVEAHRGDTAHLRTTPPTPLASSTQTVPHNYFNPLEDSASDSDSSGICAALCLSDPANALF